MEKENKHLDEFDRIAKEICELHREKDKSYGGAFDKTVARLEHGGKFYAVGTLMAKVERLASIVTNQDLYTFGETPEDSLKDLASYAIMTMVALNSQKEDKKEIV